MRRSEDRECYRVGDLHVDVGAMQVLRADQELHLSPLTFDLLVVLVRKAPDVVSQEELLATAWRGVVVGQETIKQRIKLLREALDDSPANPTYIATVRGRGYRIVAEVGAAPRGRSGGRLRSRLKAALSRRPWNGLKGLLLAATLVIAWLMIGRVVSPPEAATELAGTGVCGVSSIHAPRSRALPSGQPRAPDSP